jgi:hypothetical protein
MFNAIAGREARHFYSSLNKQTQAQAPSGAKSGCMPLLTELWEDPRTRATKISRLWRWPWLSRPPGVPAVARPGLASVSPVPGVGLFSWGRPLESACFRQLQCFVIDASEEVGRNIGPVLQMQETVFQHVELQTVDDALGIGFTQGRLALRKRKPGWHPWLIRPLMGSHEFSGALAGLR